ncbi:UNVERIFIED_CONTAM: hypothetical protein PYX00_010541 [Menopon gallinae]|uniref:Atos-like conserved domain-containing protein n=1 Tax=Menopon gallinae TaxID=328185 RepID=A0AAW2HFZ7_9NEOP
MHSITESDGVPSDPYEVLCHMAALIIEGRTPVQASKGMGESSAPGENGGKPPKPYHEGPHCPSFMKSFNKESSGIHKCTENNVLCLRFNKLKQHLLHLFVKSVPISIVVSLGPDCLCGELRSQSTLVSVNPCKRDIILEQWTINITNKRGHEPSQMSVMNLYQAVRSLLHFSQLTAWYMRNNGVKPANVIYRVAVPGDSDFVNFDNFANHDFPVADINKGVTMKMSVKSAPRMENIPPVFCPQHSCGHFDGAQSIHQETKDFAQKKGMGHGMSPKLGIDEKEEFTDLLHNVQGVRKKMYDSLETHGKKRNVYFGSLSAHGVNSVRPSLSDCLEYLDTISVDKKGNKSKNLYDSFGNSRSPSLHHDTSNMVHIAKPHFQTPAAFSEAPDIHIYSSQMNLKESEPDDRRPKANVSNKCTSGDPNIVDDRMQISCGISGKHHCSYEYEEEADNLGTEKPPRRWLSGYGRPCEVGEEGEQDKILHGKFKDAECGTTEKKCALKTVKRCNESSKWIAPHLPVKKKSLTEKTPPAQEECLPGSVIDLGSDLTETDGWSDPATEEGAAAGGKSAEESESEDEWESSPNPFMAAILRTTKKCRKEDEAGEGTDKACDNSQTNLCNRGLAKNEKFNNSDNTVDKKIDNDIFLHKLMKEFTKEEIRDTKTKVAVPREDIARDFSVPMETCQSTPTVLRKNRPSIDLRLGQKLSAVRNLSTFGTGDCPPESCGPSEFITKSLTRLKSLFDKREENSDKSGRDELGDFESEDCVSNNANNTRNIPVPSAQDKLKFRRSLDSAAQLVFHRCSGLPLTSSPAPVRRNNNSFTFDSSLNSVSAIKSALFDSANSISSEDENESEGSLRSPASPGAWSIGSKSINYHSLSPLPLLGTFEESVLNGRLEPVSTVQGFTAELGASGTFCPRHLYLPVTVFFYTLGDNDKVSAPYLGHINLGKKGYNVPRSGTIQVTLFNPLRTVVKMFVVVYDLHDMPPNSQTFLRQRTLYVPASQKESIHTNKKDSPYEHEDYHKYLRYLIHLRFISGKTGRIYLHTDIRMIIFRKADEDTATALGRQVDGETYELRSHTHGPTNPKFSPRK